MLFLPRLEREPMFSALSHSDAEPLPFSIEKIFKPFGIDFRRTVHPQAPDLSRYHPKRNKPVCM